MKFALLAAAAVIATPVLAQETPATAPTDQTAPAGDPSQADATATPAPPADPSAPPPPADPAQTTGAPTDPSAPGPRASAPADPNGADPAGGYAPAASASGPAQPGARVVFKPAPSPSEAFPPSPPMKKYPVCKKGQYDNCIQRGGK